MSERRRRFLFHAIVRTTGKETASAPRVSSTEVNVATEQIRYDFNNVIAKKGRKAADFISKGEIARLEASVRKYQAQLQAEKQAGKLGFADLPDRADAAEACRKSAQARKGKFDNFVVLGIGGSALGPIAVHNALHHPFYNLDERFRDGWPRFFVEDNIDPDHLHALLSSLDLGRTLFNVISKSGGTAETMSQFLIIRDLLRRKLGQGFARNIVITTDPHKGLMRQIVDEDKYESFGIPENVGGRFSELSPVGLFPAAMTGIDVAGLLAGARDMARRCSGDNLWENPAYMDAAVHYLADTKKGKTISVMMPYSSALRDVADWYRQLWAESLGKKLDVTGKKTIHAGQTPVKALGATDQHSQVQLYAEGPNDKIFTFIAVEQHAEQMPIPACFEDKEGAAYLGGHTMKELLEAERVGTEVALSDAGRPTVTITVPKVDEFHLGGLLYFFELETAMAGKLYKINAFDQPGVEAGKQAAYALMGRKGYEKERARIESALQRSDDFVI